MRESLFNVLAHAYGDPVKDSRVLDLFAGTGALGIEALSRGAAFVCFVEEAAEARGLIPLLWYLPEHHGKQWAGV